MIKKILLLGDSLIDTFDFMGSGFPELRQELQELKLPYDFELKNHGVGSTGVDVGLKRMTEPYEYKARGRNLLSVSQEKPDLIILESFAYNHFGDTQNEIERYIKCHKQIIDIAENEIKTKILLLVTVAPNINHYASGVLFLGWDRVRRVKEYELIMHYFQKFVEFAKGTGLPIVDLFTLSLNKNDTGGNLKYISNVDYIHLSFEGRTFIAKKLSSAIATLLTDQ